MSRTVVTTRPGLRVLEAREEMRRHGVHHLVVVDDGHVVGVVSDRDRAAAPTDRVRDVMTAPVVTASADTELAEAAALMRDRGISCLPVVDDRGCVGIVTASDLLDWVARGRGRD